MVDVVALGARRGHDGGVGDGRAVVAGHRAGHAGGDGNDHDLIVQIALESVDHNGDQDAEGTPGGAGG